MSLDESGLGTLEDQREVTRVLLRYCELLDTGQVDRIATEVYAAEARADYNLEVLNGRGAINDFLVVNMARYEATAHALSNVAIKACDGQLADVNSMITAWHWFERSDMDAPDGLQDFGLIVVTTDRLERMAEGWRVTDRRTRALGRPFVLSPGPTLLLAERD